MTHEMSMASTEGKDSIVNSICSTIIPPLIKACENSSSHFDSLDRSIYKVNCLNMIEISISEFQSCSQYTNQVQALIATAIQVLVDEQVLSTN